MAALLLTGGRRFYWQAALILLPVAALGAVGVWFLSQDKAIAQQQARERARLIAEADRDILSKHLFAASGETGLSVRSAVQLRFDLRNGLIDPVPFDQVSPAPQSLPVWELNAEQSGIWRELAQSDPSNNAPAIITAGARFLNAGAPDVFHPIVSYLLGRTYAGQNDPTGFKYFDAVLHDYSPALSESGLDLKTFAAFERGRLMLRLDRPDATQYLDLFCSNLVRNPSFLTPLMLEKVAHLVPGSKAGRTWRKQWEQDEMARAFFRAVAAEINQEKIDSGFFWMPWRGGDWGVAVEPETSPAASQQWRLNGSPKGAFEAAVTGILRAKGSPLPDYFGLTVIIEDKVVIKSTHPETLLAEAGGGWRPAAAHPARIDLQVHLTDRTKFYARERTRVAWFLALIGVASLAALIGLVAAWRTFHQQERLSEMKTGFVSSVSHELRAPIASIRLMAESLERGTVAEPARQSTYYHFIVQECRRLSSLIENVLDFARIEQGRKEFEFEWTDPFLVAEQSVKVMEPAAAERRVALRRTGSEREVFPQHAGLKADGRALQQAMVNLIDNAIKHSPAGSEVTIGIEIPRAISSAAGEKPGTDGELRLLLWVEDQGEGIHASEHQRIFEKFYRVGSELRRETAGVGIGLTIVKTIVEAHGGRVRLRSEPGKGSRFIIDLPLTQKETETLT